MNIDKFLKFFVPKDHDFHPLFEKSASNLQKGALLLKELIASSPSEYEVINAKIKYVEHEGDEITKHTYMQLNKSFITPFDREDIHELVSNIDNVLDTINGISRRICLYKPAKMLPVYKEIAELIILATNEIQDSIQNLAEAAANKEKISESCSRVKEYENKADDFYFTGISDLFENEKDPIELIKNNKILEKLERCMDEADDVTDTIKTILVKMV